MGQIWRRHGVGFGLFGVGSSLPQPLGHRYVLIIADDYVVQQRNSHEIADLPKSIGQRDIFRARAGIAGRVVVQEVAHFIYVIYCR